MAGCDSGFGSGDGGTQQGGGTGTNYNPGGNPSSQEGYKTYTAYDEAGNAFILVVTENETYVLSIQRENGTTLGSSTGTVSSSYGNSYTLTHKGGNTFTVIINGNIIVTINSPIPLDGGGAKTPEGMLSPRKPSGTITKYTVTFDANGATSGVSPDAQTVTAGSSIWLPSGSGLSKTGFTFGGWNTNVIGTGKNYDAGSSYTVTGNVTLYAKWDTNKPKLFIITDLTSLPSMVDLKICQIGTTLEEARANSGVVAKLSGFSDLRSGYSELTFPLYDVDSYFDWTNPSWHLTPWTGGGTFDVYYIDYYNLGATIFNAYKFSAVNFSSEKTYVSFSSAIKVVQGF